MLTVVRDAALEDSTTIAFHVYGSNNQELYRVKKAVAEATAKRHGGTRLVTYDEVKGTSEAVKRGEKAVEVVAFVRKAYRATCPISGEDQVESRESPRTLKLFVR